MSAEEIVVAYHERTKHHFHRFAASLGYMDWATQPDPFRRYDGAALVRLPLPEPGRELAYWQLHVDQGVEPAPLAIDSISIFFRYALSLTAWKSAQGTRWSLRANPSSGNLHPTEGYAVLPAIDGLHERPGVYHYAPREHGLERRAEVAPPVWTALTRAFPESSFLVGLTSVSLAGGLEVRRARVPLLPARCRTCARGPAVRRGCPGMEAPPPRPHERLGSLTAARPRS